MSLAPSAPAADPCPAAAAAQPDLAQLLAQTPPTRLQPLCFFVSWQGVLTVAYRGFPGALANLKRRLQEHWPELPRENPGSLWPKTTLAPLRDGVRLTPQQLATLVAICKRCSADFQTADGVAQAGAAVPVTSAAVAVFACRSLERCLSVHEVALRGPAAEDACAVAAGEAEYVARVVAEADNPDYWFAASRDGSRESHYRGAALGCTLMVPVGDFTARGPGQHGAGLLPAVQRFRAEVDAALPGMYAWLEPASYHVTIRGLMG